MSLSFPESFPISQPPPPPTPQSSAPATPTTTVLSCVSCRSRKIKCSKSQPACTACQRSNIDCVYPARTRLPRGKQGSFRARNAELSRRLNRLESLVGRLGVEHVLDESDPDVSSDEAFFKNQPSPMIGVSKTPAPTTPRASEALMTSDGVRYLSGDFWSSLSKEVDGLKQLLNEPSDDEDDTDNNSPRSTIYRSKPSSEHGPTPFIFSSGIESRDLRKFHPPSPQMTLLCDTYFHRCDPLCKILHKPSVAKLFARAGNNLADIGSAADESLMFSMYYAAVSSMGEEECMRYFREEKDKLLRRWKYATEVSLANADFLNSMDLVPLQAFSIYLMCSRLHSNSRDVWALTALALRLAQALDLPRDGLGQNLPPFEAEMRRRLWWEINVLDTRGSEDRGTYPMILEKTFTTRKPLNINDEDIDPSSETEPEERIGFTDMTFFLITCEGAEMIRRLNYVPPTASDEELEAYGRETERITKEVIEYVDTKFLNMPCAPETSDLYQLTNMVSQLCKKKAMLCCQYPLLTTRKAPLSDANREEILASAIWILENDPQIQPKDAHPLFPRQWIWYSRVFVQWHPLAVALVQLCLQTSGPTVEHAWSVVEKVFDHVGGQVADDRNGNLWKPIKRLLSKAQAARAHALQNGTANTHMGEANDETHAFQDQYPVGVPEVDNPEDFLSSMTNFDMLATQQHGDENCASMGQDVVPNGSMEAGFMPEIGDISLEHPPPGDAVNWTEWCEFVNSTWDPNQAVPRNGNGGGTWNSQFGFWTV